MPSGFIQSAGYKHDCYEEYLGCCFSFISIILFIKSIGNSGGNIGKKRKARETFTVYRCWCFFTPKGWLYKAKDEREDNFLDKGRN